MVEISVRFGGVDDREELTALGGDFQEKLGAELAHPAGRHWVAGVGGEVVGYLLMRRVLDEWDMIYLFVRPSERGQGVATALLEVFTEHIRSEGGGSVFLEVRETNRSARGLYLRAGFVEAGLRRGYYEDTGEDALLFKKVISG